MRRKVLMLVLAAMCTVYTACAGNLTAMAAEGGVTESADIKAERKEPTISIMTVYIEKVYVDLRINSADCAAVNCKISGG